jgi:HPr kinase/phosphorylase
MTASGSVEATNIHATALVVGRAGVLVSGRSGAGKTALAIGVIRVARAYGIHAAIVADDRCLVRAAGARLCAAAPDAIAGLAEIVHLGPMTVHVEPSALIDLHISLVEPAQAPRFAEERTARFCGVDVAELLLPERASAAGAAAMAGWLAREAFVPRLFAG